MGRRKSGRGPEFVARATGIAQWLLAGFAEVQMPKSMPDCLSSKPLPPPRNVPGSACENREKAARTMTETGRQRQRQTDRQRLQAQGAYIHK